MKKLIFSMLFLISGTVNASIIYTGNIINDSGFHSSFPSINAINQSGLSHNYTSGVTNYDTYVSLSPTHTNSSSPSAGALDLGVQAAFIDFDFGQTLTFTDFGLWNDVDTQGIKDFNIFISDYADFSSYTTLGLFSAIYNPVGYGNPIPLQQFNLDSTSGRYVRVDMLSTHGSTNINFGEFIFGAETAQVPEPTSLALLGLGLAGISFSRKKRKV